MKKAILVLLSLCLVFSGLLGCSSSPAGSTAPAASSSGGAATPAPAPAASGEVKTLDLISCLGATHKVYRAVEFYADMVSEVSGGQLVINLLGGDEVMAEEEQLSALKSGIVDIMWDLETLSQICPMYPAMACTGMTSREEMEAGLYDLYREAYWEEGGVYWLGKASQPQWWVLASNKPVYGMDDIKGMKIRCNSATSAAVESLGGVPTIIAYGEIYEAMERGVVDGFIMTPEDWVQNSWQDVTAYFCDLRILEGGMTGCLVNQDVWNSLTEQEQEWLRAPFEKYVDILYAICYHNQASGEDEMVKAGVTKISWSREEQEKAQALIRQAQWDSLKGQITPKYAEKFAEICGLDY